MSGCKVIYEEGLPNICGMGKYLVIYEENFDFFIISLYLDILRDGLLPKVKVCVLVEGNSQQHHRVHMRFIHHLKRWYS